MLLTFEKQLTINQLAHRLIQLVLGIPVHNLPQHVVDLRQIILDNAGCKFEDPMAGLGMS
jgi:hypothetical protein